MLHKVFLGLCLILIPMIGYAQVENLIENGSFEDDSDVLTEGPGWTSWFSEGNAEVAFSYDDDAIDGARSVKAEIIKSSDTNWHIGLIQSISALTTGETYTFSFWAKAENTRPIGMEVKRDPALGGWEGVTGADFTIEQEWDEYTGTFDAAKDYPDHSSQIDFWLAEDPATIWFDFVHVYQGDYVEIQPSITPTAVSPKDKLSVSWARLKLNQ